MKSITVLFILLFTIQANIQSQEDIVKEIRKEYIAYNKFINDAKSEGMNYWPPKVSINTIQNRPALGPVNIEITYYYDEHTNREEVELENAKTWSVLRKVVYTESMPSYTDYKEILYDKDGKLLFYYSKLTGFTCGEKRFYFSKDKLIKIKFNPFESKDCSDDNDFPSFTHYKSNLTKDDLDWEKAIVNEAKNHKVALSNIFGSTQ